MRLESIPIGPDTDTASLVAWTLDTPRRGATGQRWTCSEATARAVVKILGCPEPDYPGQPFVLLRGLAISIDASVPDGEIAREVDDPDPE